MAWSTAERSQDTKVDHLHALALIFDEFVDRHRLSRRFPDRDRQIFKM
jgi:hypothetical protein